MYIIQLHGLNQQSYYIDTLQPIYIYVYARSHYYHSPLLFRSQLHVSFWLYFSQSGYSLQGSLQSVSSSRSSSPVFCAQVGRKVPSCFDGVLLHGWDSAGSWPQEVIALIGGESFQRAHFVISWSIWHISRLLLFLFYPFPINKSPLRNNPTINSRHSLWLVDWGVQEKRENDPLNVISLAKVSLKSIGPPQKRKYYRLSRVFVILTRIKQTEWILHMWSDLYINILQLFTTAGLLMLDKYQKEYKRTQCKMS